jgi:hypothetical protein
MLSHVMEERAMTKTLGFLLSACLASTLGACAGQADVRYSGTVSTPELVALDTDPSVMVVANADEPVFYTDDTYWLYRDNRWYRSSSHRGGWARVERPPERVWRIERPTAYVHFRRGANTPRTTFNERERPVEPQRHEAREHPDAPMPAEQVQPPRDRPLPANEPNPQGPQQPYANPLPPQQVPPPPTDDGIAPDRDRAPVSPGMRDRAADQRPAADRDDRRGLAPDRDKPLPPKE